MYDKRPTRWADLPRTRSDVFLPVLEPWEEGEHQGRRRPGGLSARCRPSGTRASRTASSASCSTSSRNRKHHATTLPAIKPTVAEFLRAAGQPDLPAARTTTPTTRSTTTPTSSTAHEDVPELEALHRWAMVLHNQYPWDRSQVELAEAGELADDDVVVAFHPRNREVRAFLRPPAERRRRAGRAARRRESRPPVRPFPEIDVRRQFTVHAPARGAGRRARRPGLQQRRPDPQHRLQLVADERRRDPRQDRDRGAPVQLACRWRSWRCRPPRRRWRRPGGSRRRSAPSWSAPAPAPG